METNAPNIKQGSSQKTNAAEAVNELYDAIYQSDASLAVFYCSANYDLTALEKALAERFTDIPLIGCTTAGEIGPNGLLDDSLVGFSIESKELSVATALINLEGFSKGNSQEIYQQLQQQVGITHAETVEQQNWNQFFLLLCDGTSNMEERLVSAIHEVAGSVPLVGGSAGDAGRFEQAQVYFEGKFHANSALLSLVNTSIPFITFKTENFIDNDGRKVVITEADVSTRTVLEINGMPAIEGYAELFDINVDDVTPEFWGTHPIAVKLGDQLFIRSISKKTTLLGGLGESLSFACAIDEGVVLTSVNEVDIIANLKEAFDRVHAKIGTPALTLGFDCLYRKTQYSKKGVNNEISSIMCENNVIGFNTYGEQFDSLHVNQTFTAIAFGNV